MESLNGTLKLSGNLTGEEIPVIIKEKTVVEKDYENLDNKPSINDVILEGNKTPAELGLTKASDFELYKQSVDRSFRGVSESIRSVKTESKTYTDNATEATKAYSDGKNSDLETAINETINNKNNATRAYASHLVTEEIDARETADEETLTASKSYTDTAVVKEVTKGPASSLEFEGLQEGIPFPKIILTVPDEYVYEEGKTAHSINICCNNYADPDATELYSENMIVVAKSNTVEIGYDDAIKLLKQVPGKCVVGFSNEEDAAVCTLTVTGALKYEALKRIYSECWNRIDVEKDNMEGYVRGYTDTEITKCKEYTDEKIAEVCDITAKGNPVQMDNLQGGVPFSEIVVSGKNLLKYPYYNTTKTINGITFTDNGDGTITANGTATATVSYFLDSEFNYIGGITYTISGCPKGGSNSTYKIKGDRLGAYIDDNGNGATYSFKYDTTGAIVILIYKDTTVDNIVFRPQLEYGDTATEYEPPITGRELTVNVSGKNMFDGNLIIGMIQTETGILTGGTKYLSTPNYISVNGNCTYSLSNFENIQFDAVVFYDSNKSYISATPLNRVEPFISHFTTPQNCKYIRWRYLFDNGASIDMLTNIQLELGDTATAYEPYHGSTTTITPDSNPYTVPNDIRQVDGLNTIIVSEGEISVVGVRKNAALKRVWKEMNDFNVKIGNINTILESVTGGAE